MMQAVFEAMLAFFEGDAHQIQHAVKVHAFARMLGIAEGLDAETQRILEMAAILHDVGIKPARARYGRSDGSLQEREGPPVAEAILRRLEIPEAQIRRVCYLVGHHHTYTGIDGADYQILIEADFLVNIEEEGMGRAAVEKILAEIFKTPTGLRYARWMFPPDEA